MNFFNLLAENPPTSATESYWQRLAEIAGEHHEKLRSAIRRWYSDTYSESATVENIYNRFAINSNPEVEQKSFAEGSASYVYDGPKVIDTLQKALAASEIDLNEWEVVYQEFKTYTVTMKLRNHKLDSDVPITRTNYYCRLKFGKRARTEEELQAIFDRFLSEYRPIPLNSTLVSGEKEKVGVVMLADFHYGANIKERLTSPAFNVEILYNKMDEILRIINSHSYDDVAVFLLGDFIESFCGLNHMNTWREIDTWGWRAVKEVSEMLARFLSHINNLGYVGIVNGNHDRVSQKLDMDPESEGGDMIADLLRFQLSDVEIQGSPFLISKEIDDIHYVVTHGHHGISNMDEGQLLFDYGKQGMYNVIAKGHIHSRKTTKLLKSRKIYDKGKYETVGLDNANYRSIIVPSLFTGNVYSTAKGYSSSAGFNIIEASDNNKINMFDYSV